MQRVTNVRVRMCWLRCITLLFLPPYTWACTGIIYILRDLILIGPCIIVIVENKRPTWCHLLFLFHFLCAQHVSDNNMSIIRSLRLFCWITTLVVLFLVRWTYYCPKHVEHIRSEIKIASDIKLVFCFQILRDIREWREKVREHN